MRSASLMAVAAAVSVLTSACATLDGARAPSRHEAAAARAQPTPTASCINQPVAPAPLSEEVGVYRAGPLTLAAGDDLAQHPAEWPGRRTSGSQAIAVLAGGRPMVLSVDRSSRTQFSLRYTPTGPGHASPELSDGTATVRFPACGRRLHRYYGEILFRGTGCARLHVTALARAPIPMPIPIGNTLRGCPTPRPLSPLARSALPYLGVHCPQPNSIACDRVGVGVHMSRAATLMVVQVAGRLVTLSPPTAPRDDLWLGDLFDAGLRHGALTIHIPRQTHFWTGTPAVYPRVRVTAFFANGTATSLTRTVQLHPRFG